MSKSGRAAKSAIMVMLFILVSKGMGFFREILIAANYGSAEATDTYYLVFRATGIFVAILNSGIQTTLLPILTEIKEKNGKEEFEGFLSLMINWGTVLTIVLVVTGWILAPITIRIIGTGLLGEQFFLAIDLFRIGIIMIIFVMITSILTVYMQYHEQFIIPAITGIPLNLVFLIFLLFLSNPGNIKGLMIAMVVGYGIQLLMMVFFTLKRGYSHHWSLDLGNPYMKKTLYLATPVMIGTIVQQVNTIIDTNLATRLVPGSLSSLAYASRLEEVIVGVFILTIATIFFPMLTKAFSKENYNGMKEIMAYGINFILMVTIPVTIGVLIYAKPVVKLFFERRLFDETATNMTYMAFIFYSIGLTGIGIREMANKMFYSLKDNKTPMYIGMIGVVINIVFNLILIQWLQHSGLALATSIATLTTSFLLMGVLRKKMGTIKGNYLLKSALKISLASGVMGLGIWMLRPFVWRGIEEGFIVGMTYLTLVTVGAIIFYGALCYLLRIKEFRMVIDRGYGRMKKILRFNS